MSDLTAQQLFNAVSRHLIKQGRPAVGPGGGCVLLADNGDRCAAGFLIPPGKHRPAMEGRTVYTLSELGGPLAYVREHRDLVVDLATAHDCASKDYATIGHHLRFVAIEHGLSAAVVEVPHV